MDNISIYHMIKHTLLNSEKLETVKVQGTRVEKVITSPVLFLSFLKAKTNFPKDMFFLFYTFKMSN